MFITTDDYLLFMSLIETKIHLLYFKQNHEYNVKEEQLKLLDKWLELNHVKTPNGYDRFYDVAKERELKSWIVKKLEERKEVKICSADCQFCQQYNNEWAICWHKKVKGSKVQINKQCVIKLIK